MWALTDAVAKHLGQSYPTLQIVWGRFFFNALIVAVVFAPRLGHVLRTQRPWLQCTRAVLLVTTVGLVFLSIQSLSLVTASAIFFMGPILLTVLAIVLLGERVGPRTWIGVLLGFAGAMIVIRPGTGMMQAASLLPLGAALSSALYQIATRQVSFSDPAVTTLLYGSIGAAVVASILVPWHWQPLDLTGWLFLVALGITGGIAQLALIKALTLAPASTIAPYHYTNLIWAALLGYLVFDDVPDAWTVSGALIIALSGVYVLQRGTSR
jgi:drug/metabolite transporter (DMT)-like permease